MSTSIPIKGIQTTAPHPGMGSRGKADREFVTTRGVDRGVDERERDRDERSERFSGFGGSGDRERFTSEREDRGRWSGGAGIGAGGASSRERTEQRESERDESPEGKVEHPPSSLTALHGHRLIPQIEEALVKQARCEFSQSSHYLAASLWFDERNLKGFAKLFRCEAKSEACEGYEILEYIVKRRGKFWVKAIPEPELNWRDAVSMVQSLYEMEVKVMGCINDLILLARKNGDYNTELFLHCFVKRATNTVDEMHTLVEKVKAHSKPVGLLHNLDKCILQCDKLVICGECGASKCKK